MASFRGNALAAPSSTRAESVAIPARRRQSSTSTPAGLGTRAKFVVWLALVLPVAVLGGLGLLNFEPLPAWFLPFVGAWLLTSPISALVLTHLVFQRPLRDIHQIERSVRRLAGHDFDTPVPTEVISELGPSALHLQELGQLLAEFEMTTVRGHSDAEARIGHQRGVVDQLSLENARLQRESEILRELASYITRDLGAPQICGKLIATLEDKIHFSLVEVYLCEGDPCERMVLAAKYDRKRNVRLVGDYIREFNVIDVSNLSRRNILAWPLRTGNPLTVRDFSDQAWIESEQSELLSQMVVPLAANEKLHGILFIGADEASRYNKSDEHLVASVAGLAAVAIHNVHLNAEAAKVDALRELDRLKTELLSTVSHELRTPLASIKGYSTTLLRSDVEWDQQEQTEFLGMIDEEADRLSSLINDLLEMSAIEAGVFQIRRRMTNVGKLAQKLVKRTRAHTQLLKLSCHLQPGLSETAIDARRIEQVVTNLLENAIKYSQDGGRISVSVEEDHSMILVSVADQGIGIPQDEIGLIFDRFYRVQNSRSYETGGSGLGLAICRGIVEAHGGQIWVESDAGKGSVFTFSIPITRVEEEENNLVMETAK
jgi:signal transduction histidine kinase